MKKPSDILNVDFDDQRFRTLELRALYELGLTVAVVWVALVVQLVLRGLGQHYQLRLPGFGLDLWRYNLWVAVGFSLVWLLAWSWTRTWVVLSEDHLTVEQYGVRVWRMSWHDLHSWSWDWHWSGVPIGVKLITQKGGERALRLGFVGVGRHRGKVVEVYPDYVPLIKALSGQLPGEEWRERPPARIKSTHRS